MPFEDAYRILANISGYSVIIPILAALAPGQKRNRILNFLLAYLVASLLTEVLFIYLSWRRLSTKPVEYTFCLLEFVLISMIFYRVYFFASGKRRIFIYLNIAILGFFVLDLLHVIKLFNPLYMAAFTVVSVVIFLNIYKLMPSNTSKITDFYFFWINSGFFYFFGSSLALFTFRDFILNAGPLLSKKIWMIHLFNNIVFYLLLSYGIWKARQTSRS